jgi:drug/metabolite transporter (DMT)-like permease
VTARDAVLRALLAIALLSIMDAVIKALAAHYATFEVAFLRFAGGTLISGMVAAVARPGWPSRQTAIANGWRGLLVVITATTFFYALGRLPLAETLALSFLAPIFIAVLGMLILRERVDRRVVGGLAAGFAGMAVIVWGHGRQGGADIPLDGALAALASAISYAFAMVLLRARARHDRTEIIVLFQNIGPALLLAAPAAWVWTAPRSEDLWLILLLGMLGTGGHLLMAQAFARAEAARLAPLEYTALIWAIALGYGLFGEIPTPTTLAGAALIVAGAFVTARVSSE